MLNTVQYKLIFAKANPKHTYFGYSQVPSSQDCTRRIHRYPCMKHDYDNDKFEGTGNQRCQQGRDLHRLHLANQEDTGIFLEKKCTEKVISTLSCIKLPIIIISKYRRHSPVSWLQLAPLRHLQVFLHPIPQVPGAQVRSQRGPRHPDAHTHVPSWGWHVPLPDTKK